MKGIQYLIDEKGKPRSVLINLREWGEAWEDFYDILIAKSREHEPSSSWESIKKQEDAKVQRRVSSISSKRVRST